MKPRLSLLLTFGAIGAFTLASQTLLLREYLVSFQGNELGIAVFYGSWLLWIGVGSMLALALRRRIRTGRAFLPLVAVYPLLVGAQLVLITLIRPLAGLEPFELFPIGSLLVATALTNSPVSTLTGMLFTTGCLLAATGAARPALDQAVPPAEEPIGGSAKAALPAGQQGASGAIAARLYAFESLGSFLGGVLVTLLLWRFVPPMTVFHLASAGLAACLVIASRAHRQLAGTVLGAVLLVASFTLLVTPARSGVQARLDELRWSVTLPGAELLQTVETPYQRVSIGQLADQTVFLADGSIVTSTAESPDHQVAAALLVSQAPGANKALVLGIGMEGMIPYLLRYGLDRIDVVQVDRRYHEATLPYYDQAVQEAFQDPRVHAHFGDPREFLALDRRDGDGAPSDYDLVVVNLPDPDTAYLNRFYTVEFYRTVQQAMSQQGVIATQLLAGENYAGTEMMEYGRSVFASLQEVFGQVEVTPSEQAWLFASSGDGTVTLDANLLGRRLSRLSPRDEEIPVELFLSLLPAERVEFARRQFIEVREDARATLLNTDRRPITLFLNLLVLGTQGGLKVGTTLRAIRALGLSLLVLPLVLFVLLRLAYRLTTRQSREQAVAYNGTVLLAGFGATSMCLSILLLIAFQNRFGVLFLSVGILSALFMLGLFAGGLLGIRLLQGIDQTRYWPAHLVMALVVALCLLLPVVTGALDGAPRTMALVSYHLLFLLTGTVGGLGFPLAGYYLNRSSHDTGLVAGLLESMDHWGGAVGAAVIGVLVLPVLGQAQASLALVMMLAAIWVLFVAEQVGGSGIFGRLSWIKPIRKWLSRIERCHRTSRHRGLAFAAVGLVVTAMLWSGILVARSAELKESERQHWVENPFRSIPGAPQEVVREETPFAHYIDQDPEDPERFDIIVESRTIAPDVRGFSGPINLMVAVGSDGRMHRVALLEHQETPAYLREIDRFLARFEGWPVNQPIVLGSSGLDAMTGATISSRAIATIAEQCRQRIATDILGHREQPAAAATGPIAWDTRSIYVLAMLLVGVLVFLRGKKTVRLLFLAVNLALAGFWLNIQFSLWHMTQLLTFQYPPPSALQLFLLVSGLLLVGTAFGQIHCGLLCPFGALQELLGRLGLARRASPEADRRSRLVKHVVLVVLLVAFFVSRSGGLLSFDPLQEVFTFHYQPLMIALLAIIVGLSLVYFRFWCRYLCPVGAFWSLFNKLSWARRWVRTKRYNRCDLGVKNRYDPDCIQCNRCLDGSLGPPPKRPVPASFSSGVANQEASPARGDGTSPDPAEATGQAESGTTAQIPIHQSDIGEPCETAVPKNPARSGRTDALLYGGVAAALLVGLLLVAGVGSAEPEEQAVATAEGTEGVSGGGVVRSIDADRFRRLIEAGDLSDREAMFYRWAGQDSGAQEAVDAPVEGQQRRRRRMHGGRGAEDGSQ
ncbi:MAG: FMN-binding protein [Bradymonadales bacterium]|nr:FMN-binding protein [Bradymonadales bacterium]